MFTDLWSGIVLSFSIANLLGLIPAKIAGDKGYSFGLWWLLGALLFIAALPLALILPPNPDGLAQAKSRQGFRQCPFCAEFIRIEANLCHFCGKEMPHQKTMRLVKKPIPPHRTRDDRTIPCPLCTAAIDLSAIVPGENICPYCSGKFIADA